MLCNGAVRDPGSIHDSIQEFFDHANLRAIQCIEFGSSGPRNYFLEQIYS